MKPIYAYLDYRDCLRDFYAEHKARNPSFSYGAFARLARIKSKGLMHDILTGRKSLSKETAFKLAEAMKLDERGISYFQSLVDYCQAATLKEKSFLFRKLREAAPASELRRLREDGYEFYSQWYYHTLLELLPHIRFKGDYEALGRMLEPPISARQARKGVELLLALGLLEQTRTGFHPTHKLITSGADVQAMALRDFHIQNLELALRSIDAVPRADRDLSCVVMALSREAFARAGEEVAAFRKKLLELSARDGRPTRVYHFGFLAYPTTGETGAVREGLP